METFDQSNSENMINKLRDFIKHSLGVKKLVPDLKTLDFATFMNIICEQ